MLTIRKGQIDAFAEAKWRHFVPTACDQCRARRPEICSDWDSEQLRAEVETGIQRARAYGFESASSVIRYLDYVLTMGRDFDERPWVAEILSLRKYQPESRLELLDRTAAQRESRREEVAAPIASLPDVSWPQPERRPVPPAPVLLPPDESCLAGPPPEFSGDH